MKKFLSLLLIGALTCGLMLASGCGKTEQTPAPAPAEQTEGEASAVAGKTFIVGTNPAFAPFEFQDTDGNMTGFDLDLIAAIAKDQGFEVTFKDLEFDALTVEIQNGSIDIIASGMSITPDRQKQVAFSNPYVDASLGIAVAEDNTDIVDKESLAGKVLAAQIGTTGADACTELVAAGGAKDVKLLQDYNLCMLELDNGGADAAIIDVPVVNAYMQAHPGKVKLIGEPFVADFYGFAFNKADTDLLEAVNAGLANVMADGTYMDIAAKYDIVVAAPNAPEGGPATDEK